MSANKPRTARYAPGVTTFEQIIRAAENVLVEKGHAALTLRGVAEACGLQVGNLSYYFPTKRALVKALLDSLIANYQGDMAQIELRDSADSEAMLTSVMFYWMKENQTRRTSRIYVELWSMGNNDAELREAVDRAYLNGRIRFNRIFKGINPELTESELSALTVLAISLMEGVMVFANVDRNDNLYMPLISAFVVTTLLNQAKSPDRAQITSLAARWREPDRMGGPK